MKKILSIDIGGTNIKTAVVNSDGELFDQNLYTTPPTLNELINLIKDELKTINDIEGLSISSPGAVDSDTTIVGGASAVPYIHNFSWSKIINKEFNLPVTVENDANCGALGEFWKGNLSNSTNSIYYVIGTGIGGAVIINSKLYKTKNHFAGEFGYPNFGLADGSISSFCSIGWPTKKHQELSGKKFDVKKMFETIEFDENSKNVLEEWVNNNVKALLLITYFFDPEKIVLSGGVTNNDLFLEMIRHQFAEETEKGELLELTPEISAAKFKNYANIVGAAYCWFEKYGY